MTSSVSYEQINEQLCNIAVKLANTKLHADHMKAFRTFYNYIVGYEDTLAILNKIKEYAWFDISVKSKPVDLDDCDDIIREVLYAWIYEKFDLPVADLIEEDNL
jgi:hypothetical protein